MKYYKVIYALSSNNECTYPSSIKGAIWSIAHYHYADNVMIGGTDSRVEADDINVIELTEDEASSLIEEFKRSYPEIPEEETSFLPGKIGELKSDRIRSSKKKRQQ